MSGRRFAYAGVIVGLGVSIWANVAHAMTAPHPEPGALGMAGFWPLALFLALEVLSRTRWAGGRALLVARGGVALVAAVAAVVSWLHLHGLLTHYGESAVSALAGPLAIDGLMAVSAAALLAGERPAPAMAVVSAPAAESPRDHGPALRPAAAEQPRAKVTEHTDQPGARSDAELLAEVRAAIEDGRLPAGPSGNQLRQLLGVGAARAGRLAIQLTREASHDHDHAR